MNTHAPVVHIVDDDPSIRTSLGRVLRTAGYQVVHHESANNLLQNLPEMERGCILLDVQMPGLSGPQLQEVLAKLNFELPIIFLTGHGDFPTSVKAIKAGAEDFLAKVHPRPAVRQSDAMPPLQESEAEAIRAALGRRGGHLGQAAAELGISRTTLWRKMSKYGIPKAEFSSHRKDVSSLK